MPVIECDVAIIGGGPSGSTAGALIKKYGPHLNVVVLERERFPREHVGESLLPPIMSVLNEMGCWDKVEEANFPIKVGATYRWGKHPELWDLDFVPPSSFAHITRPAKFAGPRAYTAFQVDRPIYDKILLDHAKENGVDVRETTKVVEVLRDGNRVAGLRLESGDTVVAKHYIDASGTSGFLRRAMKVKCEYPTTLQNIAMWDYWQNAEWAVKIGVGGTRIQVRSLGYGWLGFIPLGPTRTSVGLVIPAKYYKESGKRPEELYKAALQEETAVAELLKNATSENGFRTTKDWSHISERMSGENWFLLGDSAGFSDPILSAGLTIAQLGAREVAFTILELERGVADAKWLKEQFDTRQKQRIRTHIRFADFWYTVNAQFKDLKEFTSELAKDSGLDLSPDKAWMWLSQGGFIQDSSGAGTGGFSLNQVKRFGDFLTDLESGSPLENNNVFELNLGDATWTDWASYDRGAVRKEQGYVRNDKFLPISGAIQRVVDILQQQKTSQGIVQLVQIRAPRNGVDVATALQTLYEAMEGMIHDGWIRASHDPAYPPLPKFDSAVGIRWNRDTA